MHTAARYGHAGVTRILLIAKCNVNEQNQVSFCKNFSISFITELMEGNVIEYIYIAPHHQGIYSAMTYMMLNVAMNEHVQSVCNTKHCKLKESPVAGTHMCVISTNGSG